MTRFSLTRTLASKSLPESGPPLVMMDRLPAITTIRTRSQGRLVSAFRASRFLALNKEQTAHWHRFPRKSVHLGRSWFFFPPWAVSRAFFRYRTVHMTVAMHPLYAPGPTERRGPEGHQECPPERLSSERSGKTFRSVAHERRDHPRLRGIKDRLDQEATGEAKRTGARAASRVSRS